MTDDPLKQTPACELDRDNRIIRERLRSLSPYLHGSSAERTMAEAADLIERLKAENARLKEIEIKYDQFISGSHK